MEPVVQTELDELRERVEKLEQLVATLASIVKGAKADASPTGDTPTPKKKS